MNSWFVFITFFVASFVCISLVEEKKCKAMSGYFISYNYDFFSGCMVSYKGSFVPLKNIRLNYEGE